MLGSDTCTKRRMESIPRRLLSVPQAKSKNTSLGVKATKQSNPRDMK